MSEQGTFWNGISTHPHKRGASESHKAADRRYRRRNPEKVRQRRRAPAKNNPEKAAAAAVRARKWRKNNPEKARQKAAQYRKNNSEKVRAAVRAALRRRRGVKNATGETRVGSCPLCLRPDVKLVLDHDHETGLMRGWLCDRCNRALGFWETLERIRGRVIAYLLESSVPLVVDEKTKPAPRMPARSQRPAEKPLSLFPARSAGEVRE
jgi:hypothetical protein